RQRDHRPGRRLLARVHRGQPGPLVLPLPRLLPPARGDERVVRRLAVTAAAAALHACAAAPAHATSRKLAIADFRWSPGTVTVDRGDTVTWFWTGPDTQHSITG